MNEKSLLKTLHDISRKTGHTQIGDDAAIVDNHIISTDQFIEGTHFEWHHLSPFQVGYKGVVQALSDLAAMASRPRALLMSCAWPLSDTEKVTAALTGIERACLDYAIPLVGGDISRSSQHTYFDFIVIGENKNVISKSGARPGDLVAVTGPLGSAKAGLMSVIKNLDHPALVEAFQKPQAQINKALSVNEKIQLTSLTDISDGLAKSLYDVSEQSGVGLHLIFEKIPHLQELSEFCKTHQLPLMDFVLNGGEDYQLLMTLSPQTSEKVISDHGLTIVGSVSEALGLTMTVDGTTQSILEAGWDPFIL